MIWGFGERLTTWSWFYLKIDLCGFLFFSSNKMKPKTKTISNQQQSTANTLNPESRSTQTKVNSLDTSRMKLQLEVAIKNADSVHFSTLMFIAHIAGLLYGKKGGVDIFVVKYERLLRYPFKAIEQIMQFCDGINQCSDCDT